MISLCENYGVQTPLLWFFGHPIGETTFFTNENCSVERIIQQATTSQTLNEFKTPLSFDRDRLLVTVSRHLQVESDTEVKKEAKDTKYTNLVKEMSTEGFGKIGIPISAAH